MKPLNRIILKGIYCAVDCLFQTRGKSQKDLKPFSPKNTIQYFTLQAYDSVKNDLHVMLENPSVFSHAVDFPVEC